MNRHVRRALTWLAVSGAFGIAAALYVKTEPASSDQHATVVDRFGTLRTLDARIGQQTLAARHGLSAHYDPLTQSTQRFAEEAARLASDLAPLTEEHRDLSAALTELGEAAQRREKAVENFKTQNSVLKNSLYYLPLAAEQVSAELERLENEASEPSKSHKREAPEAAVRDAISDLTHLTLAQNLLGGREEIAKVEAQIKVAESLEPMVVEPVRGKYRLFIAHAKTASTMQRRVDPLVRQDVLDAPVAAKLAELERGYGRVFDGDFAEAAWYRTVLYGWSTLLLVAVLLAGFKLRRLYARLEKLVEERTKKLHDALEELWGEMALAKKIQTALVPRDLALKGCDVAGIMRPTDQVGGDYYDVFEIDGVEWVLIGDVSGHGVPAGLVMMMCQTAVRSALTAQPDVGPDELLAIVNRTLVENIARLGEDKYMTISALRREPDGSFRVAGMHQDLLIYRARSGSVEHLHAQGTWLGIASDIRALNPVRTVRLSPGDSLVLYTDGVTEARRDGSMLDVGGLKETVAAHGAESAQQILDSILAALDDYEVSDDVAAIIIKQIEPTGKINESAA